MIRSELLSVDLLTGTMAEHEDFGTQSLRKQHCIMAQSAQPNDPDFLSRPSSVPNKRRKHSQSGAKHRTSMFTLDFIGNGEHELCMRNDSGGVSSLGFGAVGEFSVIGVDHVGAVVFVVVFAGAAFEAGEALGTYTGALPNLDVFDIGTDASDFADDFVTGRRRHEMRTGI